MEQPAHADATNTTNVDHAPNGHVPVVVKRGLKHACERCRKSKLKCLLDTVEKSGKCKRCLETDSSCVFLPAAPRQRRRRTDARVSSLEKELEEMKSLVRQLQGTKMVPQGNSYSSYIQSESQDTRSSSHDSPSETLSPTSTHSGHPEHDHAADYRRSPVTKAAPRKSGDRSDIIPGILDDELISKEEAIAFFQNYVELSIPLYPAVSVQKNSDFETMRHSRPVLLCAMVVAASGAGDPQTFEALTGRLRRILVDQVFIDGRKSLELVQAIVIFVFWHCPPNDIKALSFYQWIHIAGTMALQLGIDWRPLKSSDGTLVEIPEHPASDVQMEVWRTMFAVWESCSSTAITLQRRPLIEWSAAASKNLIAFEKNATTNDDKRLIAWVKLQLISQEIESLKNEYINNKESGITPTPISSADLEKRFMEWENELEPGVQNASLGVHHLYCRMKLHELAMHQDSNMDELLPPFLYRSDSNVKRRQQATDINPNYVRALLSLLNSCHALLDAILAIDVTVLRRVPTTVIVRGLYATKALSLIREASKRSDSDISKVIDDKDVQFDAYTTALISHYGKVAGDVQRRTVTRIRAILQKITAYQNMETRPISSQPSKPEDSLTPLDCSLPATASVLQRSKKSALQDTALLKSLGRDTVPEATQFDLSDQTNGYWPMQPLNGTTYEDDAQVNAHMIDADPYFQFFYSTDFNGFPSDTLQDFNQFTMPNIPFNAADSYTFD